MTKHIHGLIAAPFTPLNDDGTVWFDQIPVLVEHLIRSGVAGLFVNGGTGEGPLLTVDERRQTAESFVKAAAGRIPVIVQVGGLSVFEAAQLARHAEETGAGGVAAFAPMYFRPSEVATLAASLKPIATASNLPFYFYHVPSITRVEVQVHQLLAIAAEGIPTFAGVKFTHTAMDDFLACVAFDGGRFDILSGFDEMLLSYRAAGGRGAIGTTYNFMAPLYLKLIDAYDQGDLETARSLQQKSVAIIGAFCRFHPLAAMKATMNWVGVPCGPNRLPIPTLTAEERDTLKSNLEERGFFDIDGRLS